MGLFTQIRDGITKRTVRIDEDNAMLTKAIPIPTVSTKDDQFPLARFLTDNGKDTGSPDMSVDGSVTSQEFFIPSANTGDRYVTNLAFGIFDTSAASVTLKNFGNINNGLTEGVQVFYETEQGRIPFQQGQNLKTNFEFVRMCLGTPAFGTGTDAFKAIQVVGQGGSALHGYFPVLDVRGVFGFQWGIRLRQSADQKIIVQINDDISSVGEFRCYATGFDLAEIS